MDNNTRLCFRVNNGSCMIDVFELEKETDKTIVYREENLFGNRHLFPFYSRRVNKENQWERWFTDWSQAREYARNRAFRKIRHAQEMLELTQEQHAVASKLPAEPVIPDALRERLESSNTIEG